jgi:hypothetical protein
MSILVKDSNGVGVPAGTWGAAQNRSTGSSSAQSSAVGSTTTLVRLAATEDCYVKIGADPTAAAGDPLVFGGSEVTVGITPGHKIAAIRRTTDGILNITELA